MTVATRFLIAIALAAAAGCTTTTEHSGKIDPTIASFIEPKDIKWVPNAAGAASPPCSMAIPPSPDSTSRATNGRRAI